MEFYLLTAGVFLFLSYEKQMSERRIQTPYSFLRKRFKRFFPWAFAGFLFAALVARVIIHPLDSFDKAIDCFSGDIWEILLVNMNGMNNNRKLLNVPAWTLSSMLIVQYFVWACLFHFREKFIDIVLPLTVVIGLGIWRFVDDAAVQTWIGFTTFGTLRAWIGICMGYYALKFSQGLKTLQLNKSGKWSLTALELLCHTFAIWAMLNKESRNYQWCCMTAFIIAIAIELSGHSQFNELLNKVQTVRFLGEFSMCIYLTHATVLKYWRFMCPQPYELYTHKVGFTLAVLGAAIAMYCFVKCSGKLWDRVLHSAKEKMLE